MLVDDDKDMCQSLKDVLELDSDYNISYTTNPFKALEIIKTEDFLLIIIDYKMPKMDGTELIKHIKKIKKDTAIFLLTAFISTDLIKQAEKAGANKVLSKFIWPEDILIHVKETLAYQG